MKLWVQFSGIDRRNHEDTKTRSDHKDIAGYFVVRASRPQDGGSGLGLG